MGEFYEVKPHQVCAAWHHQACWREGGEKCSTRGNTATGLEDGNPASGKAQLKEDDQQEGKASADLPKNIHERFWSVYAWLGSVTALGAAVCVSGADATRQSHEPRHVRKSLIAWAFGSRSTRVQQGRRSQMSAIRNRLVCGLLVASCALTQGCGTIFFRFKKQPVFLTTVPEGASYSVDGGPWSGEKTPCKVMIQPTTDHTIKLQLIQEDGTKLVGTVDEPRSVRVAMIVCNTLLTAGLGFLVDWLTGALFYFPNRRPNVILQPEAGAPAAKTPAPDRDSETAPSPSADPALKAQPSVACYICGESRTQSEPCATCGTE